MSFLGNSTSEVPGLVGSTACRVVVSPHDLKPAAPCRRRGNVMLFVIFILGTLFASSIAFLTLMRADLEGVAARKSATQLEGVFSGLSDEMMRQLVGSVMGQGVLDASGNLVHVPYAQDVTGKTNGIADNPDVLSLWTEIAGVHFLLSSIAPYDSGFTGNPSLDLEYFAVTDLYRAWDDRADVRFVGGLQPTNPLSHPFRIRPLDGSAAIPMYDDTSTFHEGMSDADGDGVVDSRHYRIALWGDGEADWGAPDPSDNDDFGCDGVLDQASGAPSYTGGPPTPVPCDDFNPNGAPDDVLVLGTVYPPSLRRALAARYRDPDTDDDLFNDMYFSLRLLQNGGFVNIDASHRALVDNLFGLGEDQNPVAGKLINLPYGPGTERSLRHRGILAPFRPGDSLSLLGALGEDMLVDGGLDGSLYRTFFGALTNDQGGPLGELQWTPVLDEPGISGTDDFFDLDWADRWMNPNAWNDLNNSAGLEDNKINFAISQFLTTVSTDDLFLRNGKYGAGLLSNIPQPYDPAADALADALGNPYFPNPDSPDSAAEMYPGYDLDYDPATGTGDRSFIDTTTGLPKVPLAVVMDPVYGYGRPRDKGGTVAGDVRYGHLQFCLHSIGDINNPTQREIRTVQDYFTIMLRNVKNYVALGLDPTMATPADLSNAVQDQAAQLTANLIDFADFDGGRAGGGAGNPGGPSDMPTRVASRSTVIPTPVFYGIEKQPYISEVHWDQATNQLAIELTNPHNVPVDLAPTSANGFFAPYSLRLVAVADDDDSQTNLFALPFESFSIAFGNVIPAGGIVYVANDYNGLPGIGRSPDALVDPPDLTNKKVQLVRRFDNLTVVVCDEVDLDGCDPETSCQFQRDNDRGDPSRGWRVTVAETEVSDLVQTLGSSNITVVRPEVAPVHATTDDMGLESAFPTTGSMLLLMRYANTEIVPANAAMSGTPGLLDNGHMPVFDPGQLAQVGVNVLGVPDGSQPMDGTTQLSVPWGQLVFDYFTALPFDNQFDPTIDPPLFTVPTNPGDSGDDSWPMNPDDDGDGDGIPARMDRGYAEYVAYLRGNQPTVDSGGVRVHGRININAAPWKVMDGLPLMPPQVMPIYKGLYFPEPPRPPVDEWTWSNVLADPNPNGGFPMGFPSFTPTGDGMTTGPVVEKLGEQKAKGIVAYRELREIRDLAAGWRTGDYNVLNGGSRERKDLSVGLLPGVTQRHTAGFLTVGELANVRNAGAFDSNFMIPAGAYQMDNGQTRTNAVGPARGQNYLIAVAPLAALSDWVTVKGHTFTAYGVLSGHGEVSAVRNKAERFEMVFDRSNVLISNDPAERPDVIYKLREPLSELNPN